MSAIGDIAKKYRRALRNGQGTRFTAEELQTLAELGLLPLLSDAENKEIAERWADKGASTQSGTIGSIAGRNRRSTRSSGTMRKHELRGIEALVAGT